MGIITGLLRSELSLLGDYGIIRRLKGLTKIIPGMTVEHELYREVPV